MEVTEFLSTPSARRATLCGRSGHRPRDYFYPRPPRGGRHHNQQRGVASVQISIHALREEGDSFARSFSRGRTDFYPRPPRGGRPHSSGPQPSPWPISIHALREEGDCMHRELCASASSYFYPRPPRGGRHYLRPDDLDLSAISIHALREEGDSFPILTSFSLKDFYPRPPRGGRLNSSRLLIKLPGFLSTPSARRATVPGCEAPRP